MMTPYHATVFTSLNRLLYVMFANVVYYSSRAGNTVDVCVNDKESTIRVTITPPPLTVHPLNLPHGWLE